MKICISKLFFVSISLIWTIYSISVNADNQTVSHQTVSYQIDQLVLKTMESFNVPGVSVGIIKDGRITHVKGYGVSNLKTQTKINNETLFKIASNTKAFTSAALALLVDRGKLKWSDKVIQILPEFKMKDSWVTKEFNIRDLLTHRSGLRVGAGDLMLWPEPTKFTRKDVIKNLRYLDSVGSFRDEYAYDNLLYIVAGEIVASISGMSWESFVEKELFKPIGMQHCFAGGVDTKKIGNLAAPHAIVDGRLIVLEESEINNKTSLMAAAGGIKCSVEDLLSWVGVQLNLGGLQNGNVILSKKQIEELWRPVTRLPISKSLNRLDQTNYRAYALGWRVSDYHGEHRVSHTGTLSGFMSQVIMFPSRNIGIVILTNQQSSSARNSLARGIMNIQLNQFSDRTKKLNKDWVKYYLASNSAKKAKMKNKTSLVKEKPILTNQTQYLGRYIDPWFGEIVLNKTEKKVTMKSLMSPRMIGEIFYHSENKFWVKWDDRSFDADAWLTFSNNKSGEISMSMKAISTQTDFSFDFQDLQFKKIQ